MTKYIKIGKDIDLDVFEARYLELTGEKIQISAQENEEGTHLLVGSSRLGEADKNTLLSEFVELNIESSPPVGWVDKEDSDQQLSLKDGSYLSLLKGKLLNIGGNNGDN